MVVGGHSGLPGGQERLHRVERFEPSRKVPFVHSVSSTSPGNSAPSNSSTVPPGQALAAS